MDDELLYYENDNYDNNKITLDNKNEISLSDIKHTQKRLKRKNGINKK